MKNFRICEKSYKSQISKTYAPPESSKKMRRRSKPGTAISLEVQQSADTLNERRTVLPDMDRHLRRPAVKKYNRRMKHYRHPVLKRHYRMYSLQRYAVERRRRVYAPYYEGVDRPLHIYAYIMVRGSVIEQQRHIKTVGAFGQLAVLFIKRVDNLLGNHLWFINGVIKLGTNRRPNINGSIAVVLNNRSANRIVYNGPRL